MKKKFFVTTPIYYPNDKLHIGHAYTTVLADYVNRYKKMQGFETMFLTGSDEHGQKIYEEAKKKNEDPLAFVTKIIDGFKKLWKEIDVDYDIFLRTTDKEHKKYVSDSFTDLQNKGFIYKSKYEDFYCKYDEAHFTKYQAKDGNCPVCKRELQKLSEDSYFLSISKYKDWIKNKLENSNILEPKSRVNELINNFINELSDLSISRTSFDWGIKIDNDNKHIIYVWLDALQNYLSALTYPESKFSVDEVWNKNSDVEILQFVGKEIIRFHCIYWPIILKMKDYRSPFVLAHGWLVSDDGDKMSKSKGNVVDPLDLIKLYDSDSLRFYLVNNISLGEDGKFSQNLLEDMINGILVNKYSNLVARTDAMVKKYFNGMVPKNNNDFRESKDLKIKLKELREKYFEKMDSYKFSDSTKILINYIEEINGFIDKTEPWKISGSKLEMVLNNLITEIFNVTLLFSSILVKTSNKVYNWLCINYIPTFEDFDKDFSNVKLGKIDFLFKRIPKEIKND